MGFKDGKAEGEHLLGRWRIPAICWDERCLPAAIVLESMEWTLKMVAEYFTVAESHAAMGTEIAQAAYFAALVTPKNQLFSQARYSDRFTGRHFI